MLPHPTSFYRHLVLSDRSCVDAALGVAAFLAARSKPGQELFSQQGGSSEPTFAFAQRFASSDSHMRSILAAQQRDAQQRKDAHWQVCVHGCGVKHPGVKYPPDAAFVAALLC